MRMILRLFLFEARMSFKGFMGSFLLIVPLAILIVLRFFLPAAQEAGATVAVVTEGPNAVGEDVVERLGRIGTVLRYGDIESMERKLRGSGSAEGLYYDPSAGQYVSVLERSLEGNRYFSFGARLLRRKAMEERHPGLGRASDFTITVPPELSGRSATSPVATMGGAVFIVYMIIIGAFLIGLGLVNDKEEGTDKALRVSPVRKAQYFIGKAMLPAVIILSYSIAAIFVLRLMDANLLMVLVAATAAFSVTMLFGLLLGAVARNENEGIGIGKLLAMLLMLAILGGTLLPESWRWIVYWHPVYWVYDLVERILSSRAAWPDVAMKAALVLALNGLYFLLLRRRIFAGLS